LLIAFTISADAFTLISAAIFAASASHTLRFRRRHYFHFRDITLSTIITPI